jgi:hypothetical protein
MIDVVREVTIALALSGVAIVACVASDEGEETAANDAADGNRVVAAPHVDGPSGDALRAFTGDHFGVAIDARRGGEITGIELSDGSASRRVLGGGGRTFPGLVIRNADGAFALARAEARLEKGEDAKSTAGISRLKAIAAPRSEDGRTSKWTVTLDYEIHHEGAVFVTVKLDLAAGQREEALSRVEVTLALDDAITSAPKYRESWFESSALPSARFAFGLQSTRSFTNELEAMVEDATPLAGTARATTARGAITWVLADDAGAAPPITGPFHYENRIALALGAPATSPARMRLVGHRPYHWIGWTNPARTAASWYPTNAEIDRMADNFATILVLHNWWMAQPGSNGSPHADYGVARDDAELRRAVAHAHERGLRVALYSRGIERYGMADGFFEKYLERDRDGLYVDWHGAHAVAAHEKAYASAGPDDPHFSTNGTFLPARAYFLHVKRLREIVGPKGFLVGHQGSFASGILANLDIDAYLPGEAASDHAMLASADDAAYGGMTGGSTCMPWPVDAPATFASREGIAKMAAWGFYPHVPLGLYAFPMDPADAANAYALPYWRVLAAGKVDSAQLYNSPSSSVVAATTSNPNVQCVVYKRTNVAPNEPEIVVVAANLASESSAATVTLVSSVLGLAGVYRARRIDPATGAISDGASTTGTVDTGALGAWDIAAWTFARE